MYIVKGDGFMGLFNKQKSQNTTNKPLEDSKINNIDFKKIRW